MAKVTLSQAAIQRITQLTVLCDTDNIAQRRHFLNELRRLIASKEERDKWQTKPPKPATGRKSSSNGRSSRRPILLPPSSLDTSGRAKKLASKLARMLTL